MVDTKKLNVLVDDLVRLGTHGEWITPAQKENLEWFAPYGEIRLYYKNSNLVIKRLSELVNAGADLTDKAYIISNVGDAEVLNAAFKFGADPNMYGRSGLLPIDRALNRNRSSVAEAIINHPNFDFYQKGRHGENVLFMAVQGGSYKLATKILSIKPELCLERSSDNSSIMMAVAFQLNSKPKLLPKVIKFINACLAYADNNNYDFSVTEVNKKGNSVLSHSPILANYLTEKKVLDLNQNLSKKEDTTKKIFKL
jgi:hypothetical protein